MITVAVMVFAFAVLVFLAWLHRHPAGQAGRELKDAKQQLRDYEAFLHQLRELAWQHQELGDPYARIVIDKIQQFVTNRKEINQ